MKQSMLAGAIALLLSAGTANADDAKGMLAGCRFFIEGAPERRLFSQGDCAGTVWTLMLVNTALEEKHRHCRPDGVTTKQAVQAVVAYMESAPQRLHETFVWVAAEALRDKWPCK